MPQPAEKLMVLDVLVREPRCRVAIERGEAPRNRLSERFEQGRVRTDKFLKCRSRQFERSAGGQCDRGDLMGAAGQAADFSDIFAGADPAQRAALAVAVCRNSGAVDGSGAG